MNIPTETVEAIDEMIARIEGFKVIPNFDEFVRMREVRIADFSLDDDKILELMIELIAYSNQARADRIDILIDRGTFAKPFRDYSVKQVVAQSAESIIREHWREMSAIRFKYKVQSIIDCATFLSSNQQRYGSFMEYLRRTGLPLRLESAQDIGAFWGTFDQIRADFEKWRVPYFRNFISLCYLLMELGFDCTKPDSAVMTAAVTLGIVPDPPTQKKDPSKLGTHPEASLRKTVETIQSYAVVRKKCTPVIDMYFLILGSRQV
jgi:3-methyladenine DNA glycosylase Tag